MTKIVNKKFSELTEYSTNEPIYIHSKNGENKMLVIFVHGLGGKIYGKKSTWGKFPEYLFDDLEGYDIGLYQYTTLTGRLRFGKSIPLEKEAEVFANTIRDELEDYNTIIFLGHSMGGLLCKAVISRLINNNEHSTLSKVSGLFLLATPQLGSLRVPKWLSLLSNDAKVLKAHNQFITNVSETLRNHLKTKVKNADSVKTIIPTWAILGSNDFWVDALSAGIGLESNQKKNTRGSHRSIVKPKSKDQAEYSWVLQQIPKCIKTFKYDVFVAAVMAGHSSDTEYKKSRDNAINICKKLKKIGLNNVYYAGLDLKSNNDFDPESLALEIDLKALKSSKYFLLYYPEQIASSVLYEAGIALGYGIPSVYFVSHRSDLPYLMQQSSQANISTPVYIYQTDNVKQVIQRIENHGRDLWEGVQ